MTTTAATRERRSRAPLLAVLAGSGPVLVVLCLVLSRLLTAPGFLVPVFFLQLWVLAGCVFGVAAIVVGVRDRRAGVPRATTGLVLGCLGTLLAGIEATIAIGILVMLSQYDG